MTLPLPSWVVTVLMQDDALALNRAIGIVRRRNLVVSSVSLGPSTRIGVSRLTTIVATDESAVERMANQLRKMVGVLEVTVAPEADCITREHALVRVRVTPAELAALLDTAELYQARVVEESPSEVVFEATASPATLVSLLRALEPFGVLDVVRGGAIALGRPAPPEPAAGRPSLPPVRVARAIPA
ncbi:MAG TPA: acetolactate synthase small subunit [Gemmatimonadales bacterium]|nr:acetolactate synthase small subunit [Gemmatimonadales bacterium]